MRKAAYWRWQPPAQLETFSRKNWPTEIIETFERHSFIWGGKWWHFDTMHFEYRPEIIAYAIRCDIDSKRQISALTA